MTAKAPTPGHPRLGRRTLLIGAAATAVLAACGSDSSSGANDADDGDADDGDGGSTTSGAGPVATGTYVLVQRFPPDKQEPGLLRLPISLADAAGVPIVDGPDTLTATITDIDGNPIGEPVSTIRRDLEPTPYYAFRVDIAEPGIYRLVVDGGPTDGAAFQVMEPGSVAVAGAGEPLPPFDTPTVGDARGVDPICTRVDPCPFHDLTLTDALTGGTPVAYIIGTPAFCITGVCAPALDTVIELRDQYPGVAFVHAEVFTDDTATTATAAVDAAHLTYEPVIWVTDAEGVIVERLDAIWDGTEVAEILDRVTS